MLHKLLRKLGNPTKAEAAVPPGQRVYAVGDIHGRLDLLDDLLGRIAADDHARGPADTGFVFLGDLVDRGPDSAGVVTRLHQFARDHATARFLMGNHEEVMLQAMAGSERALRGFCRIGGRETLLSYGVSSADFERMSFAEVGAALDEYVPGAHVAFLSGFEPSVTIGDYMFVHAGVDPSVPLDSQRNEDLRWIRDPFLSFRGRLDKVVVHGHTVRPEVEWRDHRIGIDTGAYDTGRLTALGLEAGERWVLQT